MGGLIAQIVASEIEIDSLVLLNSSAPAGINHIYFDQLKILFPFFGGWGFWNKPHLPNFKLARERIFNQLPGTRAREIYDTFVSGSGQCVGEVALWWLDSNKATRICGHVNGKKLIVAGGRDRLVSPKIAKKLAAIYPDSELRIYSENGHWLFGEPGDEIIYRDVVDWLKRS